MENDKRGFWDSHLGWWIQFISAVLLFSFSKQIGEFIYLTIKSFF